MRPEERAAEWDVVVVGAGPAGSVAAMRLAGAGLRVALVDRHEFPRDKTCGDALIPDSLRCLRRLGLLDRVRAHARSMSTITVYSPSRIGVDLDGEFVTLRRHAFDALLVGEARARGATFLRGHITTVRQREDGRVDVELADRQASADRGAAVRLTARVAILATGADVSLLEEQRMLERPEPSAFALRQYVRSDLGLNRLVVAFDRSILPGYAWIFPLPNGEYNVGCGVFGPGSRARQVGLRRTLETFLREFPLARELMRRGEPVTEPKGARIRCGLTGAVPYRAPNVLAVGETIGTTFPFTGEGIGKAMETAEIAADVVEDALRADDLTRLATYPERIEELRPRYYGYQLAERWTSSAFLSDLIARRVRRSQRLRAAASGVLNETVDPRRIFSARALLASIWG